jgi:F-type H+-transporting ATPase subunit epsilon
MKGFVLEFCSEERDQRIEGVVSFVGADASGSFGILPGREPLVTALRWGLCSFRVEGETALRFAALPGAILRFDRSGLLICCRRYVTSGDPAAIVKELDEEMRRERQETRDVHDLLRSIDRELLARLVRSG